MRNNRYQCNQGITIVEIIVIIGVLAVIAFAAVPWLTGYQFRVKAQVCNTNRRAILREYELLLMEDAEITITDYIASHYSDALICPSEGVITSEGEGYSTKLICPIHDDVQLEPGIEIIPHTGGIKVTKVEETSYLASGETVYHNGNYYVCLYEGSDPISNGNAIIINIDTEAKNCSTWNNACSFADFKASYGEINQGDMIYYNNKYYVLMVNEPGWMQLPGNWPWILLQGQ